MPHVTIEYSANVADHHDIDALVRVVHQAALDDGLPPVDGLRTRAAGRDHYRIADGDRDHAFIAIVARVGPGRTTTDKRRFIEALLDAAEKHTAREGGPLAIAWSIEITELDPELRVNRNHVRTRLSARREAG